MWLIIIGLAVVVFLIIQYSVNRRKGPRNKETSNIIPDLYIDYDGNDNDNDDDIDIDSDFTSGFD